MHKLEKFFKSYINILRGPYGIILSILIIAIVWIMESAFKDSSILLHLFPLLKGTAVLSLLYAAVTKFITFF